MLFLAKEKDYPGSLFFGACGRARTADLLITNQLLYRLSHTSTNNIQVPKLCFTNILCYDNAIEIVKQVMQLHNTMF